jgi:alpha-L-rhamnosidase
MLGSISAWFFKYLAGIRLADDSCGADKLIIKPCVPDGLENVTATYDSPAGAVKSSWKKCDAGIVFDIEIPSCTTAEIILPDYHDNVQSGKYTITAKI